MSNKGDTSDLYKALKTWLLSEPKKTVEIMAILKCIFAESEQNKLKTEYVSSIFI